MKMQSMSAPIMHQVNIYMHYFFVPYRLIWDDFEEFITGGKDGTSAPVYPTYTFPDSEDPDPFGYLGPGSLLDYLGFPALDSSLNCGVGPGSVISALPFRAYMLIYNEYYRDQNLQEETGFSRASGNENIVWDVAKNRHYFLLRQRAWSKDYFTSALPFAQRGPDVTLPIDASANFGTDQIGTTSINGQHIGLKGTGRTTISGNQSIVASVTAQNPQDLGQDVVEGTDANKQNGIVTSIEGSAIQNNPSPVLGNGAEIPIEVGGPTINELRRSIRVQEWFEKNARGGARYIEQIFSHFGVRSSDARLQRPEYLGGSSQPLVINELLQTSQTTSTSPQGTQTGNGVSLGGTNQFKRFFEEHGIVMGIMSIVPKASYQQGIPRQWLRRDKFDFAWPELAHLGEQEIKNQELFYKSSSDQNDGVFGYTPRYAEYKFIPSSVHGEFRKSMDFWHLGRVFNSLPGLNEDFISIHPSDFNRIFPVDDAMAQQQGRFYCQLYNHIIAKRPLPRFGTPIL